MSDKGSRLEEARTDNILSAKPSKAGASEEYYAYMLRQEKLKNVGTGTVNGVAGLGFLTANETRALKGISDLDQLELKALARLSTLADNSPELLQYFAITHCGTREEVAKKLAKKQLRKQLVEEAVNKVIDPSSLATSVKAKLDASRTARSQNGFGIGTNISLS
jgi:hypothetical protein